MKRFIYRLLDFNQSGRFLRSHVRNYIERKRLKNNNFSIICNTCIGGVISHDMGLKFLSPTVNLYMTPTDFVKFLENIEYYLSITKIEPIKTNLKYPVGKLDDITLYFKHYKSIEEATEKWMERKERINWDNVYIMMTDRWCCPYSTLERFDKIKFKNKVCFTAKDYPEFPWCKQVKKKSEGCVYIITNIMNIFGKRLYQYAKNFDYIDFLNNKINS